MTSKNQQNPFLIFVQLVIYFACTHTQNCDVLQWLCFDIDLFVFTCMQNITTAVEMLVLAI